MRRHINFYEGTKIKENKENNMKKKAKKDSKIACYLCCIYGNTHITYFITVAQTNHSEVDTMEKQYITHHIVKFKNTSNLLLLNNCAFKAFC